MTDNDQKELGNTLWKIADDLRGVMESCEASGHAASDHFHGVTRMIELGMNQEVAP